MEIRLPFSVWKKRSKMGTEQSKGTKVFALAGKIKKGGLCAKRQARLTPEQGRFLLEGNTDFLLQSQDPLLIEFYSKLQGQLLSPRTVVCYEREAFIHPAGNVRITLDRHICTGISWRNFFSPETLERSVDPGRTVLEVKYDAFLPDIVRMAVQTPGRTTCAYSKYAACRRSD